MDRKEGIEDGQLYHVYNRGNDRSLIFGDKSDYGAFITKLKSLAVKHMVDVIVFTLMPNHYHLIVLQKPSGSLSSMMAALATSAATRFNLKYGHIGHLFQGPFKYKPVSEEALWYVACYVHLNPVRAGLVDRPDEWEFSNFAECLPRWRGYIEYVMEVLSDEKVEKALRNRLQTHIKGFLPDVPD